MSNLVIVAIPEEQDRVWKISSEQVPHMTLLFLGDADSNPDTPQIIDFVEHAVTQAEHGQFYAEVDHRGVLGPDEADVLFFRQRGYCLRWVSQFREQLLQEPHIKTAFDSTDQYDEWTPHLTLGYPTAPAKEDKEDYPFYSVCFDRIAVWDADFAGPEFRLEWPDREIEGPAALAYSEMQKAAVVHYGGVDKTIAHFGIRGMRWGQRKTEKVTVGGKSKQVTPKKAAKLDKKWQKNIHSVPGAIAVHNAMADHFNSRIGSVNDKFKKDDFTKTNWDKPDSWTPREKAYDKEITHLTQEGYQKGVEQVHGTSPTGKLRAELAGDHIVVHEVKIQHAGSDPTAVAVLKITRDSNGLITKAETLTEGSMSQTAELGKEFLEHQSVLDNPTLAEQIKAKIQSILDDVTGDADKDLSLFGDPLIRTKIQSVLEDFYKDPNVDNAVVYDALGEVFLSHWGVKGMHWGVRRSGTTPKAVSSKSTHTLLRGHAKVQTEGGQHHPAHGDAIKVAEARQKMKKSGTAALSNKELQDVATRLNLENQVHVLTSHKGKKFVTNQFHEEGKNIARRGIRVGVTKGLKRAGKVGAAAALA